MKRLRKICDGYSGIIIDIAVVLLCIIVLLCNFNVFTRYCLHFSWQWVEEVCRYLEVFVVMLVAGPLVWKADHIVVDVVINLLPKKAAEIFDLINCFITTAFMLYISYYGVQWVMTALDSGIRTNSGIFEQWMANLAVPLGMIIGSITGILACIYKVDAITHPKEAELLEAEYEALHAEDEGQLPEASDEA